MTSVLHTTGDKPSFEGAAGFRAYLDQLEFARLAFELVAASNALDSHRGRNAFHGPMLGFLVHSLLGVGLHQTACVAEQRCTDRCNHADRCAWARLVGCEGGGRLAPMGGVARVPPPYRIETDWREWRTGEPFRTSIWLFGAEARYASVVAEALVAAASAGVGRARIPMSVQAATVTVQRLGTYLHNSGTAVVSHAGAVRLTLRSPLRLMRRGQPLRTFSLPNLVQNLNLRLAVWGHYHQGLAWAPRWPFLDADAHAARVVDDRTRWEERARYSSRQQRLIRTGGLTGSLVVENASPTLQTLLRVGQVLGAGKGGTIGLGCVSVRPGAGGHE